MSCDPKWDSPEFEDEFRRFFAGRSSSTGHDGMREIRVGGVSLEVSLTFSEELPPLMISYTGRMAAWDLEEMSMFYESVRPNNDYSRGPFARVTRNGEHREYDLRDAWDLSLFRSALGAQGDVACLYMRSAKSSFSQSASPEAVVHGVAFLRSADERLYIDYDEALYFPERFVRRILRRTASPQRVTQEVVERVTAEIAAFAELHKPKGPKLPF